MQKKYQMVSCEPTIFRAYDIRGLVDSQLNENTYFTLGVALAQMLKKLNQSQVLLAWDGRLTSVAYSQALAYGLQSCDIEVIELGLMPTALMYFGTHFTDMDSGLMVTGSHNPKNYNGLKMVLAGKTLAQQEISEILAITQQLPVGQMVAVEDSKRKSVDALTPYIQYILQDIQLKRRLKVVIDYGHGAGAVVGPKLFQDLNCEVIGLYDEVDGNFPAHHPDPTIPENLVSLQQAVALHQADLGIAFDGDADRLGVVDQQGEIIWPDRLMMLFAKEVISRKPNASIVFDVKCSKQLKEVITQEGGRPVMSPTGHSLVKAIMKQEYAELAGEMSGHIFFKDRWFGFDDGIYSACRLLEILSCYSNMQQLLDTLPENPLSTPEIKIEIEEHKKFGFMDKIAQMPLPEGAELVAIDGIRLEFIDGWGLVRASNTSPCLVSRFEASDEAALKRIQGIFKDRLLHIDAQLNVPF